MKKTKGRIFNKEKIVWSAVMTFVVVATMAVIGFVFVVAVPGLMKKDDRRQCFRWQSWVKMGIWDFKPNHDMKERCGQLGVKIDVPALNKEDDLDVLKEAKKKEVKI